MLKLTHSAKKSLNKELKTVIWTPHLSSEMLNNLSEEDIQESIRDWLKQSLADSHDRASLSQSQENAREKWTKEICGLIPFALLEKSDQNGSYWRTCQDSFKALMGISEPSLKTWPKAGIMLDGKCYRQRKWEHRIREIGCGLSVPTPAKMDSENITQFRKDSNILSGGRHSVSLTHYVSMWPTPRAQDGPHGPARGSLGDKARWRSPTAYDWKNTRHTTQIYLGDQVEQDKPSVTGQLNPTWVEWLMRWPIGWSSLKPLPKENWDNWLHNKEWWEQEPDIPRVAIGIKDRVNRLKALGNGQVPHCVMKIWELFMAGA
jgi:hypothetical protein